MIDEKVSGASGALDSSGRGSDHEGRLEDHILEKMAEGSAENGNKDGGRKRGNCGELLGVVGDVGVVGVEGVERIYSIV